MTLNGLLREARPRDLPRRATARHEEQLAVRLLARVAALESGKRGRGAGAAFRIASKTLLAAAVIAGAFGALPSPAPPPDLLARALSGDQAAEAALRSQGARARVACLERRDPGALRLFVRLGGPLGCGETDRLAALHDDARLAPEVRAILVGARGDAGAAALGRLLLHAREAEQELVAALVRVAADGRPASALEALRPGAARGLVLAAAAALELGGVGGLDRLLETTPEEALLAAPMLEAVRGGGGLLHAALLRRVEGGDETAFALAAAARLEGLASLLVPRLAEERRAFAAVRALAASGASEAWRVIPLALAGPARQEARRALHALPAGAADLFAAAIARDGNGKRVAPYWEALAEMGEAGLPHLVALGARPAFGRDAVVALGASRSDRASEALARLGRTTALGLGAVQALAVRAEQGDPAAPAALLVLARAGPARAALEALVRCGESGAEALRAALDHPRLRGDASAALRRAQTRSRSFPS